jgi:hypothetical protein
MPIINNYGSLKTELSGSLFHSRFAANYARAVTSFEAVANRRLRTRQQEAMAVLTTDDITLSSPFFVIMPGSTFVPDDYLLWRTVLWTGRTPSVELDYVHPAYLRSTWIEQDHGNPKVFTIDGDIFTTRPRDNADGIYEFHYYQKIPSIVGTQNGDNGTNWLISDHPDLYLEGALTELFILARNGEAAIAHKQLRDEKFAELIQLSALTTGATSPSVRTADYF